MGNNKVGKFENEILLICVLGLLLPVKSLQKVCTLSNSFIHSKRLFRPDEAAQYFSKQFVLKKGSTSF